MKCILTIAGSDSGGGAGIQADLKTITVLGGFGMSIITALTAQNTTGVTDVFPVPVSFIGAQFKAVAKDIKIDAAKTGMLYNQETAKEVITLLEQYNVKNLVIDPVMAATSGDTLFSGNISSLAVENFFNLASLITPNTQEASQLCGIEVTSIKTMEQAAKAMAKMGAASVLVKGGHMKGKDAVDIFYDGSAIHHFVSKRYPGNSIHGTGCTLSSAIATFLGQGLSTFEAIKKAKEFITKAIETAVMVGKGHKPANQLAAAQTLLDGGNILMELKAAICRFTNSSGAASFIPEVQSNIAYASCNAKTCDDIAGIPGRLIRLGKTVITVSEPMFGASKHIAQIILAAMKYESSLRSCMNIRYDNAILEKARHKGFIIKSFNRNDEPEMIKQKEGGTMEWGTDTIFQKGPPWPDIIFDIGGAGKEPMIRVIDKDPEIVVNKVLSLLD